MVDGIHAAKCGAEWKLPIPISRARLDPQAYQDGWQSGRLRTLGKRVFLNRNPGFESLPIRHSS